MTENLKVIKIALLKKGMTMTELSEKMDMTKGNLYSKLNDTVKITYDDADKLHRILGVETSYKNGFTTLK